jgi:hypothetical protein
MSDELISGIIFGEGVSAAFAVFCVPDCSEFFSVLFLNRRHPHPFAAVLLHTTDLCLQYTQTVLQLLQCDTPPEYV